MAEQEGASLRPASPLLLRMRTQSLCPVPASAAQVAATHPSHLWTPTMGPSLTASEAMGASLGSLPEALQQLFLTTPAGLDLPFPARPAVWTGTQTPNCPALSLSFCLWPPIPPNCSWGSFLLGKKKCVLSICQARQLWKHRGQRDKCQVVTLTCKKSGANCINFSPAMCP